jgi:hypothetical protein
MSIFNYQEIYSFKDTRLVEGFQKLSDPSEIDLRVNLPKNKLLLSPVILSDPDGYSSFKKSKTYQRSLVDRASTNGIICPLSMDIQDKIDIIDFISKDIKELYDSRPEDFSSLAKAGFVGASVSIDEPVDNINKLIASGCEAIYLHSDYSLAQKFFDLISNISRDCDLSNTLFMVGEVSSPNFIPELLNQGIKGIDVIVAGRGKFKVSLFGIVDSVHNDLVKSEMPDVVIAADSRSLTLQGCLMLMAFGVDFFISGEFQASSTYFDNHMRELIYTVGLSSAAEVKRSCILDLE